MLLDQLLTNYDYQLPPELIAKQPAVPRDTSRLLVVNSPDEFKHQHFYQLPEWLVEGDLLILNNTKVIPARLYGYNTTGAKVEILLLEELKPSYWLALAKPGRKLARSSEIDFLGE